MNKKFKKGSDYEDIREWMDEALIEKMGDNYIIEEDLEITIKYDGLRSKNE